MLICIILTQNSTYFGLEQLISTVYSLFHFQVTENCGHFSLLKPCLWMISKFSHFLISISDKISMTLYFFRQCAASIHIYRNIVSQLVQSVLENDEIQKKASAVSELSSRSHIFTSLYNYLAPTWPQQRFPFSNFWVEDRPRGLDIEAPSQSLKKVGALPDFLSNKQ